MSKILGKLFGGAAGSFIDKIASVADKFITTGAEKQAFQKEMTNILVDAEAEMQKNVKMESRFRTWQLANKIGKTPCASFPYCIDCPYGICG